MLTLHTALLPSLAACALFGATLSAQCLDNVYPLTFVDAHGNPTTSTRATSHGLVPQFDTSEIYFSIPHGIPAGDYVMYVTDSSIIEWLSEVPTIDRFYRISYDLAGNQIIEETTVNASRPALGVGLDGVGSSIPVFPFSAPDPSLANVNGPVEPCVLKVFFGNCWNGSLTHPHALIRDAAGNCCVLSYARVAVGDGTPPDIRGVVFADTDEDGIRDAGEAGVANQLVTLDGPAGVLTATTGPDGHYVFPDLGGGSYVVSITLSGSYFATTSTSHSITLDGCGSGDVADFGRGEAHVVCAARTPGYWQSRHGRRFIDENPHVLVGLAAFALVDDSGTAFDPTSSTEFAQWIKRRNARNMAYQLSGHLAAMYLNLEAGLVGANCITADPTLGPIDVQTLIMQATAALANDPLTLTGDEPNRSIQERYKDALDRANNNQHWL